MKKIIYILFLCLIMSSVGCMTWIAKDEQYQGTRITMKGEGSSTSKANKIKIIKGLDGKFHQLKE